MIDWVATDSTPEKTKTLDKVVVICEDCNQSRQISYNIAKRRNTHKCMSCVKRRGEHVTNKLATYICIICGKKKQQKFRHQRFQNWRCQNCVIKQCHRDGKLKNHQKRK